MKYKKMLLSDIVEFNYDWTLNKKDTQSGIYVVVGPNDLISAIPTENVLYIYNTGQVVSEGNDYRDIGEEDFNMIEVTLVAKSSDFKESLFGCLEDRIKSFRGEE